MNFALGWALASALLHSDDPELRELMRIYLANRGVWEAITSQSPAVSFAAEDADIDLYLSVYEACLDDLTG